MKITKTQKQTLFYLGECLESLNKKFNNQPFKVSISKTAFIDIMLHSPLVDKQTRALYKNLENLEKNKLTSYKNKELSFTKKGLDLYKKIKKEVEHYLTAQKFFNKDVKTNKKIQTIFSLER